MIGQNLGTLNLLVCIFTITIALLLKKWYRSERSCLFAAEAISVSEAPKGVSEFHFSVTVDGHLKGVFRMAKIKQRVFTISLILIMVLGFGLACNSQADTLFLPSSRGSTGNNVYRYDLQQSSITLTLTLQTQAPSGVAMAPWGEFFVANYTASGTITRFLNSFAALLPNGTISGSGLSYPEDILFRGQELFVANEGGGNILRFTFDATGNAVPNGVISENLNGGIRGLAYNTATDELFVSVFSSNRINRYLFDTTGNAIANGFITDNSLNWPHGMTFTAAGELLVANANAGNILRFTFDNAGNAIANGVIIGNGLNIPIDLAFSSFGELFVTNQFGTLSRFTFDGSGNAIPNGTFTSDALYLNWMLIVPTQSPDDLIDAACPKRGTYRNHGAYVSCVSKEAERLLENGVITQDEKNSIVSKAASSNVGKPGK